MSLSRIHIRRDKIAKDNKTGKHSLALGVETMGRKKRYGRTVTISGPSMVIYNPKKPLKCGARAWIETHYQVSVWR